LERAIAALGDVTSVVRRSRTYRTSPVGPAQPDYLNAVVELTTLLSAASLLLEMQGIERELGRTRNGERWGPRTIDLDLLAFGDRTLDEPGLKVPHPELAARRFVLEPWAEIAPEFVVPTQLVTVAELCERLRLDRTQVVTPVQEEHG